LCDLRSSAQAQQQWTSAVPIVLAAAVSFGTAYFYKIKAEDSKRGRRQLEPWPEVGMGNAGS
jgi:hypothetical protein